MARLLTGARGLLASDSIGSSGASVIAGEALLEKDLVQINSANGHVSKVRNADYATCGSMAFGTPQTGPATGQILAQTTIVSSRTNPNKRQALERRAADGSLYTLTDNTSELGVKLNRYSATGELLGSVTIESATLYYADLILQLSNGNIAVFASTGTLLKYAVYDARLGLVKAWASIGEATILSYSNFGACALSGGGFAVVHQPNGSLQQSRLATFNNSGVAVLAPTTIWTRLGTNNPQYHQMVQLSNGNLLIVVSNNNSVDYGLYHGIVTTAGAPVVAFSNIDPIAVYTYPEISVCGASYSIARANGINQLAFVFNDAGIQQGGTFTEATTAGNGSAVTKLINDGSAFWLIWARSTDTNQVLTKLPLTGSNFTTSVITLSPTQYGLYIDAFYENGLIVGASQGVAAAAPQVWVISTDTASLVSRLGTTFGVAPSGASGYYPRIISGGDCSFVCMYDYGTTAATHLCIGKYASTAILGVVACDATPGTLVALETGAGAYATNAVIGSPGKAFDMSTSTSLYGNKGTILPNSVVLKGM